MVLLHVSSRILFLLNFSAYEYFKSSGQARVTIFAADGNARTFDYQAGDVGYVPVGFSSSHNRIEIHLLCSPPMATMLKTLETTLCTSSRSSKLVINLYCLCIIPSSSPTVPLDRFQDISLGQWLALTPPELVKAHLNIDDSTLALFNKTKQTVV